jgi:hypothetical protein
LQDENLLLEKARADLTLDLRRANSAKEAADAAAKAAEQKLHDVLAELDNAKHSTEAASTTSEFIRKVRLCFVAVSFCTSTAAAVGGCCLLCTAAHTEATLNNFISIVELMR